MGKIQTTKIGPSANCSNLNIYDIGADGSEESELRTLKNSSSMSLSKKSIIARNKEIRRSKLQVEINKRAYKNTGIIDPKVQLKIIHKSDLS